MMFIFQVLTKQPAQITEEQKYEYLTIIKEAATKFNQANAIIVNAQQVQNTTSPDLTKLSLSDLADAFKGFKEAKKGLEEASNLPAAATCRPAWLPDNLISNCEAYMSNIFPELATKAYHQADRQYYETNYKEAIFICESYLNLTDSSDISDATASIRAILAKAYLSIALNETDNSKKLELLKTTSKLFKEAYSYKDKIENPKVRDALVSNIDIYNIELDKLIELNNPKLAAFKINI